MHPHSQQRPPQAVVSGRRINTGSMSTRQFSGSFWRQWIIMITPRRCELMSNHTITTDSWIDGWMNEWMDYIKWSYREILPYLLFIGKICKYFQWVLMFLEWGHVRWQLLNCSIVATLLSCTLVITATALPLGFKFPKIFSVILSLNLYNLESFW